MHRSGTSALARVLSLLGADLPANQLSGNESNIDGHWESEPVVKLNTEIFSSAGINWRSPEDMPKSWYESGRFEQFRDRALDIVDSEFGRSPLFVLKDPRICKLVPFWLSVLEQSKIEASIVSIVRNPSEVAESLLKRDGLDGPLGILIWLRYLLGSERDSRGRRRVYVSYDQLLNDWKSSTDKISNGFGLRWPSASAGRSKKIDDFLSHTLKHHTAGRDLHLRDDAGSWAAEAFKIFDHWVHNGEASQDYPKLDAIATKLDKAVEPLIAPLLVSYEKAAAVQKLKTARSQQNAEMDRIKLLLRTVEEQVASVAAEFDLPFLAHANADWEDQTQSIQTTVAKLAEALKLQRETSARELAQLQAEHAAIEAKASSLSEQLASQSAALELTGKEKSDLAARLANEIAKNAGLSSKLQEQSASAARLLADIAKLSAEYERAKDDSNLRESRLHDLLERERQQRLALETKLARTERINATLLIVRGRFEAATEELARVAGKLRDSERRSEEIRKQLGATEERLNETEAALGDAQRRSKNERDKLRQERTKLQAALAGVRDDRTRRLEQRDNRIKELSRSVKRLERQLQNERQMRLQEDAERQAALASKRARSSAALSFLVPGLERRRERARLQKNLELIEKSGLFDPAYYRERYPDVAGTPAELLEHFVLHGGVEGRVPSPAFNSKKYLERYPDVAAAGLNPLVHFLESGRDEGRTRFVVAEPEPAAEPDVHDEYARADLQDGAQESVLQDTVAIETSPDADSSDESAEPAGPPVAPVPSSTFSELAADVSDWVRSAALSDSEAIRVEAIKVAVESPAASSDSRAAFEWFEALNRGTRVEVASDASAAVRTRLNDDQLIIEDAWLSGDFDARMRISHCSSEPCIVRCCQAADDGTVRLCAEQRLAAGQSTIVDVDLASRFAPIILIVTDVEGRLIDSTLLPFPTLLRGGLHHGELIDYSGPAAGWAAHQPYVSRLLLALVDRSRKFAVRTVSVDVAHANGTEPIFSNSLRHWISRQFEVELTANVPTSARNPALALLSERLRSAAPNAARIRKSGRTLRLDASCVPSLRILLAEKADLAVVSSLRTIVVDELTRRPLRAVDHPIIESGNDKFLEQPFEPVLEPADPGAGGSALISISFSPGEMSDVRAAFPIAGDASEVEELMHTEDVAISAIVNCSGDVEDLRRLLASLAFQNSVSDLECLLVGDVPDAPDSLLLPVDVPCRTTIVRTGITVRSAGSWLRTAADQAKYDRLLFVDDKKALHDPRTLTILESLCMRDETGTAGCQLVTEKTNKNSVSDYAIRTGYLRATNRRNGAAAIRPRAGGLALPSIYPVLANPIGCLLTKREFCDFLTSALEDEELAAERCDVELGRAIIEGGKLNLATSLVSISDLNDTGSHKIEVPWLASTPSRFVSIEEY